MEAGARVRRAFPGRARLSENRPPPRRVSDAMLSYPPNARREDAGILRSGKVGRDTAMAGLRRRMCSRSRQQRARPIGRYRASPSWPRSLRPYFLSTLAGAKRTPIVARMARNREIAVPHFGGAVYADVFTSAVNELTLRRYSSPVLRRICLVRERACLLLIRRATEALVGRVGRRRFGACSTARIISRNLSCTSSTLRPWSR